MLEKINEKEAFIHSLDQKCQVELKLLSSAQTLRKLHTDQSSINAVQEQIAIAERKIAKFNMDIVNECGETAKLWDELNRDSNEDPAGEEFRLVIPNIVLIT
jgi:hypothetical protein